MEPCKHGYPCPSYKSPHSDSCLLPRCVMKHVTIEGKEGEYVYDELTGRITPWLTVDAPKPRHTDDRDQWYEEWSNRQLEREIQSADTYARVHGRVRAKRHAVR